MRVVVTGAAGRIGRQLVDELSSSHELCLIDIRPVNDRKSIIADLSAASGGWRSWLRPKSARWSDAFKGANVIVHLAADPRPDASWESMLHNNIQATWNVIQAAVLHGVRRIVFASSNWAVRALEQKLAPDCYRPDGAKIGSDVAPFPLTAYGLSKAFGEITGKMFVDEGKLDAFVAVRIGHYDPTPPRKEILRVRWVGSEDIRSLFKHCIEAELKGFHVVYGVSAQTTAPFDLSHTRRSLFWSPRQSSDAQGR